MSQCNYCKLEMKTASGCVNPPPLVVEDETYDPIPYGKEKRFGGLELRERCHDCGARLEHFHHPGCDMEECPRCHGQMISCNCLTAGEESEAE